MTGRGGMLGNEGTAGEPAQRRGGSVQVSDHDMRRRHSGGRQRRRAVLLSTLHGLVISLPTGHQMLITNSAGCHLPCHCWVHEVHSRSCFTEVRGKKAADTKHEITYADYSTELH